MGGGGEPISLCILMVNVKAFDQLRKMVGVVARITTRSGLWLKPVEKVVQGEASPMDARSVDALVSAMEDLLEGVESERKAGS